MAGAGRETVNSYPEAQAVAYAQWFSHAFSLWEEQFRGRIAAWFDKRTPERIRGSDIRSDYFGDIRLIRNDFVHNRGICKDPRNSGGSNMDLPDVGQSRSPRSRCCRLSTSSLATNYAVHQRHCAQETP